MVVKYGGKYHLTSDSNKLLGADDLYLSKFDVYGDKNVSFYISNDAINSITYCTPICKEIDGYNGGYIQMI